MNIAMISGEVSDRGVEQRQAGQFTVYTATIVVSEPSSKGGEPFRTFINVEGWKERGAALAQFQAGDRVLVQGKIKAQSYTDAKGEKRYKTLIDIQSVEALGASRHRAPPATQEAQPSFGDLPF